MIIATINKKLPVVGNARVTVLVFGTDDGKLEIKVSDVKVLGFGWFGLAQSKVRSLLKSSLLKLFPVANADDGGSIIYLKGITFNAN